MSCPDPLRTTAPQYRRVAIVGVGLIGGSIGLALRQRGLAEEVVGIGRRQASLDKAFHCGAVDRITTDLKAGLADAQMVVVAAPLSRVSRLVREAAEICPANGLITDVGSVKGTICGELAAVGSFMGSHPLAGDHRSGPENARGDLFSGKVVVVTPLPEKPNAQEAIEKRPSGIERRLTRFWESLGARVVSLDPEEHDRALATTSHLPHWVASALAGATPEKWLPLTATGWRDTTRIAAADPDLWEQIFRDNQAGLLEALDRLEDRIGMMRQAIETDKPLLPLLDEAKRIRNAVGN